MENKSCIVLLLLVGMNWIGINPVRIQGVKVNERFGGSAPKDCNCITHVMTINKMSDGATILWADFKKISGFYKANCTEFVTSLMTAGDLQRNGSYTGVLGLIQRNEITNSGYLIRVDDLPLKVGILGPPLASTAGILLMAEHNETVLHKNFISFFSNFDPIIYSYFFTCLFLSSTLIHLIGKYIKCIKNSRISHRVYPYHEPNHLNMESNLYVEIVWQELSSTVSQYSYNVSHSLSLKYVWGFFILGSVFLFYHIGRNLISSDLVVVTKEPHPETVQELISEPKFSHLDVQIFGYLQLYTLLNKGHMLQPLRDRINRKKINILREPSPQTVKRSLDSIKEGKSAILVEEYVLQNFKPYLCTLGSKYASTIHFSRSRIAEGYGHAIFSSHTRPRLVSFLDYRYQTALEMGTYRNFIEKEVPLSFLAYLDQEFKYDHMICLDGVKDQIDPISKPYTFQDVYLFFSLCLFWILIATIVLFLEKSHFKCEEKIAKLFGFENVIETDKVVRKRFKYRKKNITFLPVYT